MQSYFFQKGQVGRETLNLLKITVKRHDRHPRMDGHHEISSYPWPEEDFKISLPSLG